MLSEALSQMLTTLGAYLPSTPASVPPPSVAVVRLQEKQIGLGQWHALDERHHFPVVHKGVRLAGAVRFQVWASAPEVLEAQVRGLTEAVMGDRDALESAGFVEVNLTDVSTTEHLAALPSWRQTAQFGVLYEFREETSDLAGGLIARVPIELRDEWGPLLVTGDVTVWDGDGTPPLVLSGRRTVDSLDALAFLPGGAPAGAVTVTRTFTGAPGAPTAFDSLGDFLDGVSGAEPATTHAVVSFATIAAFLAALGPPGDPVILVDEAGAPRELPVWGRAFDVPIELRSPSDRLHVAFETPQVAAGQVLYLRASRGRTTSP
jgi:hypothetical protein